MENLRCPGDIGIVPLSSFHRAGCLTRHRFSWKPILYSPSLHLASPQLTSSLCRRSLNELSQPPEKRAGHCRAQPN